MQQMDASIQWMDFANLINEQMDALMQRMDFANLINDTGLLELLMQRIRFLKCHPSFESREI